MVLEAIHLGHRAARTIRQNLGFTALYNVVNSTFAAVCPPPVWAAPAQFLPNIVIVLNAARLSRPISTGRR